jgi:hypothetical protein
LAQTQQAINPNSAANGPKRSKPSTGTQQPIGPNSAEQQPRPSRHVSRQKVVIKASKTFVIVFQNFCSSPTKVLDDIVQNFRKTWA